jgi:poly(ADP-ribose) glycohydrolase ARH3
VGNAVFLGGDTDTVAAMTGAISGAFLGVAGIPSHLIGILEDQVKGRSYIAGLADQLYVIYNRSHDSKVS